MQNNLCEGTCKIICVKAQKKVFLASFLSNNFSPVQKATFSWDQHLWLLAHLLQMAGLLGWVFFFWFLFFLSRFFVSRPTNSCLASSKSLSFGAPSIVFICVCWFLWVLSRLCELCFFGFIGFSTWSTKKHWVKLFKSNRQLLKKLGAWCRFNPDPWM